MPLESNVLETALLSIEAGEQAHLIPQLKSPDFSGYLRSGKLSPEALAPQLLELAKCFAITPVSGFHVGAIAIGSSGRIYLGANMESFQARHLRCLSPRRTICSAKCMDAWRAVHRVPDPVRSALWTLPPVPVGTLRYRPTSN